MARSPCGALDILAHGRRWAGSVLESAGRPAYELVGGFVVCPNRRGPAAFRVGGLCRVLYTEAGLRDQAAVPHDRSPQAHHRPALSRGVEYLGEFLQIDAQSVLGARVVARPDDPAGGRGQPGTQAVRKQLRGRRPPGAVRIGLGPGGVLVREPVVDQRRSQPARSADVVHEQGLTQDRRRAPFRQGTKIVIRDRRPRGRRQAASGARENQCQRGDSSRRAQHLSQRAPSLNPGSPGPGFARWAPNTKLCGFSPKALRTRSSERVSRLSCSTSAFKRGKVSSLKERAATPTSSRLAAIRSRAAERSSSLRESLLRSARAPRASPISEGNSCAPGCRRSARAAVWRDACSMPPSIRVSNLRFSSFSSSFMRPESCFTAATTSRLESKIDGRMSMRGGSPPSALSSSFDAPSSFSATYARPVTP